MAAQRPMTDAQAAAEIGWVARRARELIGSDAGWAEWAEFHQRKAALLRHLGQPELAAESDRHAERWADAAQHG